jgi:hypothetical protein
VGGACRGGERRAESAEDISGALEGDMSADPRGLGGSLILLALGIGLMWLGLQVARRPEEVAEKLLRAFPGLGKRPSWMPRAPRWMERGPGVVMALCGLALAAIAVMHMLGLSG